MIKKICLFICLICLCGCSVKNITNLSYKEIIETIINEDDKLYNTNEKGYKYYLPSGFTIFEEDDYNQTLLSNNDKYYLNIDVVSYFYKNNVFLEKNSNDLYYSEFFDKNDNIGYLKITKNNDKFLVQMCYNYAILEVSVEEENIKYAISRGISILNSLQYNDNVIKQYVNENDFDSSETVYKIETPKEKDESKNILQYIDDNEIKEDSGE